MSAYSKNPIYYPWYGVFLWERGSTGAQVAAAGIHLVKPGRVVIRHIVRLRLGAVQHPWVVCTG